MGVTLFNPPPGTICQLPLPLPPPSSPVVIATANPISAASTTVSITPAVGLAAAVGTLVLYKIFSSLLNHVFPQSRAKHNVRTYFLIPMTSLALTSLTMYKILLVAGIIVTPMPLQMLILAVGGVAIGLIGLAHTTCCVRRSAINQPV